MAEPTRDASLFVGRDAACTRLSARLREAQGDRSRLVLVSGEAGIGKTSCVRRVLETHAAPAVWGVSRAGAPGHWPWTQALGALAASRGRGTPGSETPEDRALLASIVPAFGPVPASSAESVASDPAQARLPVFDAVARWLALLAADAPIVVVLDDLHWADRSSLELLDFLGRSLHGVGVLVVGTYRHDEVSPEVRELVVGLTTRAEHIHLGGLPREGVARLVAGLAGPSAAAQWAGEIHRRTGGHPFFVRELAAVLDQGAPGDLPHAVRDVVEARLRRAGAAARPVLEAAAVLGNDIRPDVLAGVLGAGVAALEEHLGEAVRAGILVRDGVSGRPRFAHDLFRETLDAALPSSRRIELHQRIGAELERWADLGRAVPPAEVAGHFTAAVGLDGPERAVRWAFAAAAADRATSASTEAAAHLRRVRDAVADAGFALPDAVAVDLLVTEADARARAGTPETARDLLAAARPLAVRSGDGALLAAVAFGVQRLGARFAMPRQPVLDLLEEARTAVGAGDPGTRARLTAALARELSHSVPEHRPRAGPLSAEALDLARVAGDPGSLTACLLARHDVLWTQGTAPERLELARGIVELAGDDREQRAQGLLLVANAELELGSEAFRTSLLACVELLDSLAEPRHRYTATTRRAALHLVDGDLDEAESVLEDAARLGERIGEPDTGNVRMSQRLALVHLRGDPDEQRAFAAEAVRWWVGAPVHAHAVAAGFLARAGDLDAARREVDIVAALGTWRADRSYLWSVFVGQLAEAAALLGDEALCRDVLRRFASARPVLRGQRRGRRVRGLARASRGSGRGRLGPNGRGGRAARRSRRGARPPGGAAVGGGEPGRARRRLPPPAGRGRGRPAAPHPGRVGAHLPLAHGRRPEQQGLARPRRARRTAGCRRPRAGTDGQSASAGARRGRRRRHGNPGVPWAAARAGAGPRRGGRRPRPRPGRTTAGRVRGGPGRAVPGDRTRRRAARRDRRRRRAGPQGRDRPHPRGDRAPRPAGPRSCRAPRPHRRHGDMVPVPAGARHRLAHGVLSVRRRGRAG